MQYEMDQSTGIQTETIFRTGHICLVTGLYEFFGYAEGEQAKVGTKVPAIHWEKGHPFPVANPGSRQAYWGLVKIGHVYKTGHLAPYTANYQFVGYVRGTDPAIPMPTREEMFFAKIVGTEFPPVHSVDKGAYYAFHSRL